MTHHQAMRVSEAAAFPAQAAEALAADCAPDSWRLADKAGMIIRRYPDVSRREVDWLVANFRQMSMLQVALMTCEENLAPRLEAFLEDHGRRIRTPFRQFAALLIPIFMLILVVAWKLLA